MHITSGLSPASGEMLDNSVLNLYGDSGEQCGTTYFAADHNAIPESSHTVEIEYIYESPETYAPNDDQLTLIPNDISLKNNQCQSFEDSAKTSNKSIVKQKSQKRETLPVDSEPEADLTNLTWLQNITNIMAVPSFPIPPVSPNPQVKTPPQPNTRLQKFNQTISKCQKDFMENRDVYRNNADQKPPYSYSTLICMAMRNNNDKMTLSAIYSWIRENFKYYRNADPTWQVSVINGSKRGESPSNLINDNNKSANNP